MSRSGNAAAVRHQAALPRMHTNSRRRYVVQQCLGCFARHVPSLAFLLRHSRARQLINPSSRFAEHLTLVTHAVPGGRG